MSGGASGSRQTNASTNTNSIDDTTKAHYGTIWDAASKAAADGPGAPLTGASSYYTGMQGAGGMGMRALTGDQTALSGFMNPYQQNVIDANNAQWARTNAQTANQINGMATAGNAFGGSRYGVALGQALAANNLNQQSQTAGLLSSGYNDAMTRAGTMAGMGYNAAGQNANLGFAGVGDPNLWAMNIYKQGSMGPMGSYGQSNSSQAQTQAGFKFGPG
jgi:hypothetical protein